jgi:hypothetical protein
MNFVQIILIEGNQSGIASRPHDLLSQVFDFVVAHTTDGLAIGESIRLGREPQAEYGGFLGRITERRTVGDKDQAEHREEPTHVNEEPPSRRDGRLRLA